MSIARIPDEHPRATFIRARLADAAKLLDGSAVVRDHPQLAWMTQPGMSIVDQATGWTGPLAPRNGSGDRLAVVFRVCIDRIQATTGWLEDPSTGLLNDRITVAAGGNPHPTLDNYMRIVTDLLIGEVIHFDEHPDPNTRRAIAEDDLAARCPHALRLLSAVQSRALPPSPHA